MRMLQKSAIDDNENTSEEPGVALKLEHHVELALPSVRAGFTDDGRLALQVGSDYLIGDMYLANVLKTIIANESFVYMYLNEDVSHLCDLLIESELNLLSGRLKEHFALTMNYPADPFQPEGIARLLGLDAESIGNEANRKLLLENLDHILVRRFGKISDTGKYREPTGLNRAIELYREGTANPALKIKLNKSEGELIFLDSHFKAEVASPYGISAAGTSETVTAMDKTITTFERIIPRLGIYYALSQAQIALFRLGWGFKDIQASDTVIKSWISEVTARLIPASRMPSETTILYFIRATLPDGSEVNGMWPNTLSAELFYNLETGRVEHYVSEHEHELELKDGYRFTLANTADGGIAVRTVPADTQDTHPTLQFYNDSEHLDKGLILPAEDQSVSLMGKVSPRAGHFKTSHLRAPKGKEFKFVLWGSNHFDVYIVEEGQGGVYTINENSVS
ncbi:hypothetical protein SAMN02744124_02738 [Paenibacillus barengoltzii J12]|uniref:Uncharacterized protein n=2 Tax=Paenibacillus barengoltzii TaxID=343517 RepID=A0ABY1LZ41_9BACL|nr:hypothetical protein SAMN02744124_02738 [Paenibacillus barengoltzii J12]